MKKKIIVASVILAAFIIGVLASAYFSKNSGGPSNPSANPVAPSPTFKDEGDLTNIGITTQQVGNLEQTFEKYLSSENKSPNQVGFSSIQQLSVNRSTPSPVWTIAFVIQLDGKDTYKAKLNYFGDAGIRLYLYGLGGTNLLYDSQYIGGSPEQP